MLPDVKMTMRVSSSVTPVTSLGIDTSTDESIWGASQYAGRVEVVHTWFLLSKEGKFGGIRATVAKHEFRASDLQLIQSTFTRSASQLTVTGQDPRKTDAVEKEVSDVFPEKNEEQRRVGRCPAPGAPGTLAQLHAYCSPVVPSVPGQGARSV